jgi:hypothetical protein
MDSRSVVVKQPRSKAALMFVFLALVAIWGGFGLASLGFDRTIRLITLVVCGLSGLVFLYYLVRPPTVLEIGHSGIRFFPQGIRSARETLIPWKDIDRIRIFLLPGPSVAKPGMWLLSPFPWVVRKQLRVLGVVPVEGSELDVTTSRPLRRISGTVLGVSQIQLPMQLEKLASMIKEFAPTIPIDYVPRAAPPVAKGKTANPSK